MNSDISPTQFVNQILSQAQPPTRPAKIGQTGKGRAPVNIALSKYWGKRAVALNLPTNSSLSISLPGLGTETTIEITEGSSDHVTLNNQILEISHPFAQRLSQYLNYFRNPNQAFKVTTFNTVPTGAGLASSASGYAALVLALDDCFQWQLPKQQLSLLARLGSGSASRSLYPGFAVWHKGAQEDGMDSFAEPLPQTWPELCIGLIKVDIAEKKVGSTQGMQNTVETCELYSAWPKKAEQDLAIIQQSIEDKNFTRLGETAENNALSMHATMIATWPPILYWQPGSVQAMQQVWQLREDGLSVYFTMDAGPNLKLLFLEKEEAKIIQTFGDIQIIKPFKQD